MNKGNLEPCPFCDGKAEIKECRINLEDRMFITCSLCGASSYQRLITDDNVKQLLINDWNRRSNNHSFVLAVQAELNHAYLKHGREPWGRHEFYAILKEEVDEVWDNIKADGPMEEIIKELRQIACVCQRYAETGDRYWGPHPSVPRRK